MKRMHRAAAACPGPAVAAGVPAQPPDGRGRVPTCTVAPQHPPDTSFGAVLGLDAVLRDPDDGSRPRPGFAAPERMRPDPQDGAAIAGAIPLAVPDRGIAT